MKRTIITALTLLVALASGVWAFQIVDVWGEATQPDGTTFVYHAYGGKRETADGYVFVYGSDGWYYYAELDVRGEYVPSTYKVGIDDPAEIGIPKHLKTQRSAVRQAEIDAANIMTYGTANRLTQPDGTSFKGYWDQPLPIGFCKAEVPADGYVIEIGGIPLINYGDGDPFWAFVYDDESGWYYYAELDAQGEYVASPYKVGIDPPPGYDPPTAVQERSWGAVKHLFHK